ncbi:hypothetical protein R50073_01790 [Maricurvus nonylphenolicus]
MANVTLEGELISQQTYVFVVSMDIEDSSSIKWQDNNIALCCTDYEKYNLLHESSLKVVG